MSQRRYDPFSDAWVTYADHRQERTFLPSADECPLCPTRPGRPDTEVPCSSFQIAVFDNRFPALAPHAPQAPTAEGPYLTSPAHGRCEVIVYSDDHDSTLASLGEERVRLLVDVWADRCSALGAEPGVAYVMPFENRGEAVGVTLNHPHGQVYAYADVPPRPAAKLAAARRHYEHTGSCLHCDVVRHEAQDGARVVADNGTAIAYVPFAARFPYEVHIAPRSHVSDVAQADEAQRQDLAELLHRVLVGYDRLFGFPLPYVLAVHQAPTDAGSWREVAHLHVELMPPHRSAEKLKFLAGSELAAGAFIGDVLPEVATKTLREHVP